jgi:hypothetical protein
MIWPEPRLPVAAKSAFHHSNDDEHDDGQHDEAENPEGHEVSPPANALLDG